MPSVLDGTTWFEQASFAWQADGRAVYIELAGENVHHAGDTDHLSELEGLSPIIDFEAG